MVDSIAQKIDSAQSIMLVLPTDIDFASIYAGVAHAISLKGKSVTILNDALTTNPLLIHKLKDYRFNTLHTKATKSFTLIIDKNASRIKQSFVDDSETKFQVSFESDIVDFDLSKLIELKHANISADLYIITLRNSEQLKSLPVKYARIINGFPQDKVIYLAPGNSSQQMISWGQTVFNMSDKLTFDKQSLTLLLASLITDYNLFASKIDAYIFGLIKEIIERGGDFSEAFNMANNVIDPMRTQYYAKELENVKNLGNGIYFSHVEDGINQYDIKPPYIPLIAKLMDCKLCFVILSKSKSHRVFVVNNKEEFELLALRKEFNGVGDDTYFYFRSTLEVADLKERLVRKFITITSGDAKAGEISQSVDMDERADTPRFTQGLNNTQDDPLAPVSITNTLGMSPVKSSSDLVGARKIIEEL